MVITRGKFNQREPAFGQRGFVGKYLLHGADFVRGDFRLRFFAPHNASNGFVDKRHQHPRAARQRCGVGISEQTKGDIERDFEIMHGDSVFRLPLNRVLLKIAPPRINNINAIATPHHRNFNQRHNNKRADYGTKRAGSLK